MVFPLPLFFTWMYRPQYGDWYLVLHPVVAQGDDARRISVVVAAGPQHHRIGRKQWRCRYVESGHSVLGRSIYDPAAG